MQINEDRLNQLLGKMVGDMGAAAVAPLILIGDRLGYYKTLADKGPISADDLAKHTRTNARCALEWCAAQAGSGYIDYDPGANAFSMTPEQQAVFADDNSPACMIGGYYGIAAMCIDEEKVADVFRTGKGLPWGDHNPCLFCGTEKFFRPGYKASLVEEWLPALDGVVAKLQKGAAVADVGCGHGASTIVMAKAFPKSKFVGFDYHAPSVDCANARAREAGIDNARFEVATAQDFPGGPYDLVAFFDCLHDMGDPLGAMQHTRKSLKPDATAMIVEPFAADTLKDNLNPVGRLFYCFSTMVCTPNAQSQKGGYALGAQAGPAKLTKVINDAGLSKCRVATSTPFNIILEARA